MVTYNITGVTMSIIKCNIYALGIIILINMFVYAEGLERINYTSGSNVQAIADEKEYIWVGSYDGLTKMDRYTGEMTYYNSANSGLPGNSIGAIAIDETNIKWIGTRDGLARFDGTDWTVYNTGNSGLPHNSVQAITINDDNIKWIGTLGGGLALFDGTDWTEYNSGNTGLPNNRVWSITIDEANIKWLGTDGGLGVYNEGGAVSVDHFLTEIPESFILRQNYPNPFNPSTTIKFSLPERTNINLDIFNTLGQRGIRLLDGEFNSGTHEVTFDTKTRTSSEA